MILIFFLLQPKFPPKQLTELSTGLAAGKVNKH
ncbi:MAG: hypothetical protein ACJAU1_001156, partial [Psychromonas sp.]